MTQEEIIRMARDAGMAMGFTQGIAVMDHENLERFAALVAEPWIETNKALVKEIIELQKRSEQEPVAWRVRGYNQFKTGNPAPWRYVDGADKPTVNKPDCCDFEPLYAVPVRTKDLTDDEIRFWIGRFPFLLNEKSEKWVIGLARAVIAADREKNK